MGSYWLIIFAFSCVLGTHELSESGLVAILVLLGKEIEENPSQHPITLINNVHDVTAGELDFDEIQQAVSTACGRQGYERLKGYDAGTRSFIRTGCQLFEQVASTYLVSLGVKLHEKGAVAIGQLARFKVHYEDGNRYRYRSVKEIVPLVCEEATNGIFQSTVSVDNHQYVWIACSYFENLAIEFITGFHSEADFENDVYPWHFQQRTDGVRREDSNMLITYDQVKGMIASFCAGQLQRRSEPNTVASAMCNFFEVKALNILQFIQDVLNRISDETEQYRLIEESRDRFQFNFRRARMTIVKWCAKSHKREQFTLGQACDYLLKNHIELILGKVFD